MAAAEWARERGHADDTLAAHEQLRRRDADALREAEGVPQHRHLGEVAREHVRHLHELIDGAAHHA